MKQGKKRISDNVKAGILRWWIAGMCYFFIGFGTQIGILRDPIDLIFMLGVCIGFATVFIYNPIAYGMFNIVRKGKLQIRLITSARAGRTQCINYRKFLKICF